ncbi:family 78 glycoside hydrolase catalytic domain [Levilactobacillus zymae]|uniref:family 78 glycoside hydrolase catalytic domain n=1 Tax=Levilactobacillus zymae TaxID=267363 RepID=UPI0028B35195|nr:family 78 glycoside hydrolase catalytic domain [Levilactobacillus zymae]MDT6979270.1 family 78 glycoside hydrolase catalytic domain [Levilactobacillus zymae]
MVNSVGDRLLQPTHLNVNLLEFAYNVTHPRFSWWDHSNRSGSFQTAYEIVASKRLYQLANRDYLFSSGWIESAQNSAVLVPSLDKLLVPGELYYWQVRIRDNFETVSDFSQPNKFICQAPLTLAPNHGIWDASTKTQGEELPHLGNVVFLRSPQFDLQTLNVDTAIITAFSRGNEPVLAQGFDLYLNGQAVGVGSARPQAHYQGTSQTAIYYNDYEVTEDLNDGTNVVGVLATGQSARRAVWAQLKLYLNNGTQQTVMVTDETWKSLDGSNAFGDSGVRMRSLYFGMVSENVDMRYFPQDWTAVDFNDREWSQAKYNETASLVATDEVLCPYRSENTCRVLTTDLPAQVTQLGPQHYLIDLGKEIIGSLQVHLKSAQIQRLNVVMGEQLTAQGRVRHHLACGPDYIETWTLVPGENNFRTLQMKNFRYVEVTGFAGDLTPDSLRGWALQQPFDPDEGLFHSSDDLLNQEYNLAKYTIKATNQDVYVDSQARERKPYEGDLLVNGNTSYVLSSHYSLARHSIDYLLDNPTWPEDYKLFNVEMAWQDYLYTNDVTLLEKRYAVLREKFNRGADGQDNFDEKVGLVTGNGLIDWPIRERDGFVEGKYNTPFNAIYCGVYQLMSRIAAVTQHPADQDFYEQRAATIKQQMIAYLYDAKRGVYHDSLNADLTVNQHAAHHSSAYALCYGVYDGQTMADRLSHFVANDGEFIGSVYFIYFMLKGLIDTGHSEDALRLLTNTDDHQDHKTFAAILKHLGATIAPEAWSNYYKPNLTLSHPWGATPGLTIVQGIMGIIPLEPGFKLFRLRIQPGDLTHLKVTTPSAKGIIQAEYTLEGDRKHIKVNVPMNSRVQIELPQASQIVEVKDQAAVVSAASEHSQLTLPSGRYDLIYK